MRSARLYRYQLPMDSGIILRDKTLHVREGWIVELRDGDSLGRGEIAPLPGFSIEDAVQAGQQARQLMAAWLKDGEFNNPLSHSSVYPSVAFGLSMALFDLTSGLPQTGNFSSALLAGADPDVLVARLTQIPGDAKGRKLAKVKIGIAAPEHEGRQISRLLSRFPELSLRLDANRRWSLQQAQLFADAIEPQCRVRIAFLEEPCQQPLDSLHFAAITGIAIAWDETVRDPGFIVKGESGIAAVIIKPTLVGSVNRCVELIQQAKQQGMTAVISSSLESSLGLNQLARLAHWQTPGIVPGLDTVNLFRQQLETPWPDSSIPLVSLADIAFSEISL